MTSFLLRGGVVLTLGEKTQNFLEADVLIEDHRVADVGNGLRSRNSEVVDASGCIVMPGFVDTHRHLWRSLFRNWGDSLANGTQPLSPLVYGPHYEPDDVYAATMVGLLGATASGITSITDWADFGAGEEMRAAALQAHSDSGLRTVFVAGTPVWGTRGSSDQNRLGPVVGKAEKGPRTTLAAGAENVGPNSAAEWAAARELGLRVHTHAGSDPSTAGSVASLRDSLGADVTLVHCTHLGKEDLEAISYTGARVSITPASEMAGGLGSPPLQELLDKGIRPGLGVGEERVAPGDMFAQMRAANSIQHATMFDLKLSGKAGIPNMLTTREVIRSATVDGAAAVGLASQTGSIEIGKRADLIVLRGDRPNISPINDPIGAVVWGMDTSNVDWVFVDGSPLMVDGELQYDVSSARTKAADAHLRVSASAGLTAVVGGQS